MEQHPLLPRIERHLRRTGHSATAFGREAIGDPRLVADLRCGRYPGPSVVRRIETYLATARRRKGARG